QEKLAQYRRALDQGGDVGVVVAWIEDTEAARRDAEAELRSLSANAPITADSLRQVVEAIRDKVGLLATADPIAKAALYDGLGITATYDPAQDVVTLEARPQELCAYERVGGATQFWHLQMGPSDCRVAVRLRSLRALEEHSLEPLRAFLIESFRLGDPKL